MFLKFALALFYILVDICLILHLVDYFIKVFSVFKEKREALKALQEEVEELEENILEKDSVFTTHELAEVERFRQRMEALRKDRDGLYDIVDEPITTFTGVEASE